MDLTGNKDVDLLILDKLDDRSLFQYCDLGKGDEYVNRICNDEYFWMNRVRKTFGEVEKTEQRTWKNLYLNLVYYNEEYPTPRRIVYPSLTLIDESHKLVPLITKVAANNDVDILNYLMAFKGFNDWGKGLEGAINGRNVNMVKYFLKRIRRPDPRDPTYLLKAIHKGDIDIVNILLPLFDVDTWNSRTKAAALTTAAEEGKIDFLNRMFPILKVNKKVILKLIDLFIGEITDKNVRPKEVFLFLVDTYLSLGGKKNKLAKVIRKKLFYFKKDKDQSFPNLLKKYI